MPSTFLFRSIEEAMSAVNDLPYPIVSYSNSNPDRNKRILEGADSAFMEAATVFKEPGLALPTGSFQQGYVFWQPEVNRQGLTWYVFMAARRYAVVTQVPTGASQATPACHIETVELLTERMVELLRYVYAFVLDNDFKWASVEVVAGEDPVREIASPFICGISASWPFAWFEQGGMVFETTDGSNWQPTGVPAVKIFNLVASAILEGTVTG